MPTLTELQQKRGELVTQARSALDEITANTDDSRATELEQRHDTIMSDLDRLDANITREERVAKLEKEELERRGKQRPIGHDTEARGEDTEGEIEYRDVFYKFLGEGGDPSALSPEERAVLRAGTNKDAGIEKRMQTAGTTTAGGFTVPTELANFIIKSMKATGPMYDGNVVTDVTTSSGNPTKIPTIDDTSKSGARRDEGGTITDDGGEDVVFGQKSLDAYVFDTEFLRVSMELLADSAFNVEAIIGGLLGERLGRIANRELTIGDGTGDPNGIVTASSLGKTAAAVAAITFDEILELEHSVDPFYRASGKCGYMFNDTTLLAVRKLKDAENRYIWQMGNVQGGVPASLNGHRYHINQAMDSLAAAKKAMLFGDFGQYFVRKVGAPVIGVLRERFWPDLGMAGLIRFDGELGNTAAVRHLITAAS
jgi:HK97 family phage major capsid protein